MIWYFEEKYNVVVAVVDITLVSVQYIVYKP